MAVTGKLARFIFNGVTFDEGDCLQGWNLNDAINEVVYQCNSYDKAVAGTRSVTFSGSMALDATDTAKLAALTPGATAIDFVAYPAGTTATYVKVTSNDSLCVTSNLTSGPNAIFAVDFNIRLNAVVIGAA